MQIMIAFNFVRTATWVLFISALFLLWIAKGVLVPATLVVLILIVFAMAILAVIDIIIHQQ